MSNEFVLTYSIGAYTRLIAATNTMLEIIPDCSHGTGSALFPLWYLSISTQRSRAQFTADSQYLLSTEF